MKGTHFMTNSIPPMTNTDFMNATGKVEYGMLNDYMFHAILQKNQKVLTGLICSLLHLSPDQIKSITILNPIELGDSFDNKEFILDINILLNNDTIINLEMQVMDELNWPERSLSYLCRSFDNLCKGSDYLSVKPAFHIGFLNFTPFPEHPEFYATYRMLNLKDSHCYSDKFTLSVVDLTHIDLATDEDKAFDIDMWAALFVSKTWEDLKMLAQQNEYMKEAAESIYELNADELTRKRCRAREDYYRLQNSYKKTIEMQTKELAKKDDMLNKQAASLLQKDDTIAALQAEIERLKMEN